jgi:hypothetical protein
MINIQVDLASTDGAIKERISGRNARHARGSGRASLNGDNPMFIAFFAERSAWLEEPFAGFVVAGSAPGNVTWFLVWNGTFA